MSKEMLQYSGFFEGWPMGLKTWVLGDGGVATFVFGIIGLWYTIRGKRVKDQKEYKNSEKRAIRYALLHEVQKAIGPCTHPEESDVEGKSDQLKCLAKIVSVGEVIVDPKNPEREIMNILYSTDKQTEEDWDNYEVRYELSTIHWRAMKKFDTMFYPEELKSKSTDGWFKMHGLEKGYIYRIGIDSKRTRKLFMYINIVKRDYLMSEVTHFKIVQVIKQFQRTYESKGFMGLFKKKLITM